LGNDRIGCEDEDDDDNDDDYVPRYRNQSILEKRLVEFAEGKGERAVDVIMDRVSC
jgi:hypothetical protein